MNTGMTIFVTLNALKHVPKKQFLTGMKLLIATLRHTEVYMLQMPIE